MVAPWKPRGTRKDMLGGLQDLPFVLLADAPAPLLPLIGPEDVVAASPAGTM